MIGMESTMSVYHNHKILLMKRCMLQ